jgi:hypothetical protein
MSCTSDNGHLIVLHTVEKQATLQEFVDIYYGKDLPVFQQM